MVRQWLQIALVMWLTAWYGFVIPGHQRGAVLVPGAERQLSMQAHSTCCETIKSTPPTGAPTDAPTSKQKSTPFRVANCAVCAVAGLIDLPPPLVISPVLIQSGFEFRAAQRELTALELPGHSVPFKRGPPTFISI